MKWGVEIREHHAFETHLNLISDFTGSRERMSVITSFGSQSDMEESGALTVLKRGNEKFVRRNWEGSKSAACERKASRKSKR